MEIIKIQVFNRKNIIKLDCGCIYYKNNQVLNISDLDNLRSFYKFYKIRNIKIL